MARKAAGQRLDEQPHRVALVAVVEAPVGQERPRGIRKHHGGVVGRHAGGVDHPLAREALALRLESPGHDIRRDGLTKVEHHRVAVGGPCGGEGIGGHDPLASAVGGDARGVGIGAGQQDHQSLVGHALEVGGKAADVMAALYDNRGLAVRPGPLGRDLDRLQREPLARQAHAVPGEGRRKVRHDLVGTGAGHFPRLDFTEVEREQLEAVGCVTQEVALHEDFGHGGGFFWLHAHLLDESGGKRRQGAGVVARVHWDDGEKGRAARSLRPQRHLRRHPLVEGDREGPDEVVEAELVGEHGGDVDSSVGDRRDRR